jgi:hypothetical protein
MEKNRQRSRKNDENKTDSMTIRIEPKLKEQYLKFCEDNGYSYGKRLRLLIKKDLDK